MTIVEVYKFLKEGDNFRRYWARRRDFEGVSRKYIFHVPSSPDPMHCLLVRESGAVGVNEYFCPSMEDVLSQWDIFPNHYFFEPGEATEFESGGGI